MCVLVFINVYIYVSMGRGSKLITETGDENMEKITKTKEKSNND